MNVPTSEAQLLAIEQEANIPYLRSLVEVLQKFGYSSKVRSELRGVSGTSHEFDLVSKRGMDCVVTQVIPTLDYEKTAQKLIELRARAWDCSPDLAVAIVPSQRDMERLRELASFYKFVLIEGTREQKICEELEQALASVEEEGKIESYPIELTMPELVEEELHESIIERK